MKVKLLRDQGENKAGATITVSDRWGQHALRAGLACLPDKTKKPKTKSDAESSTEKE